MASSDEQVSALIDGELEGPELEQVLDRVTGDAAQDSSWARYNLISDALHNNLSDPVSMRLHGRVAAALADEPTVLVPTARRAPWRVLPFTRHVAGMAVAASVAALAIIGVQSMHSTPEPTTQQVAEAEPPPVVREGAGARLAHGNEARLNPYLVNHNEYSVSSGMQGMLPYVRVVSDESVR